ncbi:MAG: hypothetical protein VKK63_08470 [Synechococcus sp.]|nr:hypothetical protein [Synechococcus sp.]
MSYYWPAEEIIVTSSIWKVRVGARRYLGKCVKEAMKALKPEKKYFGRISKGNRYDGYSAHLLDFTIVSGHNAEDSLYPDW